MAFVLLEETACVQCSCVHYAYAGLMTRGRILFIRPRATPGFRIFVTSVQLTNSEFLVSPSVIFLKNRLIS